ncbi:hypothetical protein GIB67_009772 [Kingdonia uniflora]|uniref:Uncharacterized protein n=1 Tax=Kingdonia uniflora TaxID=39325 RepID=A0A7J7LXF2_9MAGN|nr:hypothetical protein GIB67_009772 [Kingdonia uniflora]
MEEKRGSLREDDGFLNWGLSFLQRYPCSQVSSPSNNNNDTLASKISWNNEQVSSLGMKVTNDEKCTVDAIDGNNSWYLISSSQNPHLTHLTLYSRSPIFDHKFFII